MNFLYIIIMTEGEMNVKKEWKVKLQKQSPSVRIRGKWTGWQHCDQCRLCNQTAWAEALASRPTKPFSMPQFPYL